MQSYAFDQGKKIGNLMFQKHPFGQPVISPAHGGMRRCSGSQADFPDGIHSICGMTFCSMGTQGALSHCANSRQCPQMCVHPLGNGGRMRCPSLCGSADAPHNCQAFSFIRPGSDTYRGVQPEAITAASPRCGHTSTPTHTHKDTDTFGMISKRRQFHQ